MELPYLRQTIGGLLASLGVEKPVMIEGVSDHASQDLELMVLDASAGGERLVLVINHADNPAQATLRIVPIQQGRLQVRELISFRSLPCTWATDGRVVVDVTIPARDVLALNLYPLAPGHRGSTGTSAEKGRVATPSVLASADLHPC